MSSTTTSRRLASFALFGVTLAAGWNFHAQSLVPLRESESKARRSAADLRGRIDPARKAMAEKQVREKEALQTRQQLARLNAELPSGAATTWLPKLVTTHFESAEIPVSTVRLNTLHEESELPGYLRGFWSVVLPIRNPGRDTAGLLLAVADLEQARPFVRVLDFAIQPAPEDPGKRNAFLNVSVLIPEKHIPEGLLNVRFR